MKNENISPFIILAIPSVKLQKDTTSFTTIIPGILARIMFPGDYKEIIQIDDLVKSSDLDWTIVRILAHKDTPNNKCFFWR